MKRSIVEETVRLLIAIAFSIAVARAQGRDFTIQVESAPSEAEAKASVARLRAQGLEAYWVRAEVPGLGARYRVRIGRYQYYAQARTAANQLVGSGAIKEYIIAVYDEPPAEAAPPDESKPAPSTPKAPPRARDKKDFPSGARPVPAPEASRPNAEKPAPAPAATDSEMVDVTINDANWKVVKQGAGIDKNLRAVYFVDSLTGWAAGEGGAVYRTTDGGRDWKPVSIGSTAEIYFIRFIDWNRGWMLGKWRERAGQESEGENILFITTNGGRAWAQRTLPNVTSLHFIDAWTGWAVGKNSTMLKTTDGGMEWSPVGDVEGLVGLPTGSPSYSLGFSDITFTDPQHGWLIANYYGRGRSDIGGVFRTWDGGATWRRVILNIQTKSDSGPLIPGALHSAHFTDANTGSITGEMYDGNNRYFFALHTRDGGKTWNLFRIPSGASHATQFLDPARGWTAAFAPRAGGGEATVYDSTLMRTGDGGLSWRKELVARGRRVRGLFFLSPTRGWAVGDRGMILSYEERAKAD